MRDAAPSIRSIFGEAAEPGRLVMQRPVHAFWNSRGVSRAMQWGCVAIFGYWVAGLLFTPLFGLAEWLVPDALQQGRSVMELMGWALLAWFVATLLIIVLVDRARGPVHRVPWPEWAARRAFVPVAEPSAALLGVHRHLTAGRSHAWHAAFEGSVAGQPATVGSLRWVAGDADAEQVRDLCFVRIEMPEVVAAIHQGRCGLFRWDLVPDDARYADLHHELRLESIDVDSSCTVRVDSGPDRLVWRRVFDSTVIDAMARRFDVSWRQEGRDLLLVHAEYEDDAPVEVIDTMCAAGAFLSRHLTRVGATTLAAERPAQTVAG